MINFEKNQVYRFMFYASLLLLGFMNDFPLFAGSSTLRSPSTWFLLLIPFVFVLLSSNKIKLSPNLEQKLLILLLLWIGISFLANFFVIASLGSQETDGPTLFTKTIMILVLSFVSAIISGTSLSKSSEFMTSTRKWLTISFLIVAPYALLEVFYYLFALEWASELKDIIDVYVHHRRGELFREFRVRGLAFEASFFGVYCSVIFPWLLSYFFYKPIRRIVLIPLLALFFLFLLLSQSRTAYVTILAELLIYIVIIYWYAPLLRRKISILSVVLGVILVCYGSTLNDSIALNTLLLLFNTGYESNITRVASQHAAMLLAFDNPLFGVGLGLSGAHIPDYYPSYAWLSSEMNSWAAERVRSLSTPAFSLFAQIASEIGLIGLVLFLINGFYWLIRIIIKINVSSRLDGVPDYLGISLLVSSLGVIIASFGLQGYSFPGYWILLSLVYAYINSKATT